MSDPALLAWLNAGMPAPASADESAARRRQDFSQRFMSAIAPEDDLGATCELHEAAVALNVYAVHRELNALGEVVYSEVWQSLGAPARAAIKRYLVVARSESN